MPGGGPQTIASPGPSASQALHTLKGPEFLLLLSFLDWGWVALNSPESRRILGPEGLLEVSLFTHSTPSPEPFSEAWTTHLMEGAPQLWGTISPGDWRHIGAF